MKQSRVLLVWSLFALVFAALVGRLFVLTVFPDGKHRRWQDQRRTRAHLEHLAGTITDDGRGRILFRNGQPIESSLTHLRAGTVSMGEPKGNRRSPTVTVPAGSASTAASVVGQVGLPDEWPDTERVIPEQGRSGLELRFDSLLAGKRPGYLGVMRHGTETAVYGASQPLRGADIRTTLDAFWQQGAEHILADAGIRRGAIVVLNTRTNEILAMASTSPASPFEATAVRAVEPGSIFKLVTAATGYESYRFAPNSQFICPGYAELPGVLMRCWRVHGRETLTDAIAQSCDAAFAVIGSKIGRVGFETMWARLHLSSPQVQTVQAEPVIPGAQGGVLFRRSGEDNGLLANTAIGQEDVRLSPLQGANLASTIANHGRYRDAILVKDAEVRGKTGRSFAGGAVMQAFSPYTAAKLASGMELAVTSPLGTAHDLFRRDVRVAAKTGTAELHDGRVNAWLTGFAPADVPEFAFCVVDEDVSSPLGHKAVHLAVKRLLELYRQIPPIRDIR